MHANVEQEWPIPDGDDLEIAIRMRIEEWANEHDLAPNAPLLVDLKNDLLLRIGTLFGPGLDELAQRRKLDIRQEHADRVALNPNDPFDSALIPMVAMNRRKRADYAQDGDAFDNFATSSWLMGMEGFGPIEAGVFNVSQKLARLKSLRANGRMNNPKNEAVEDTYLDLAVYAVLTYAMARKFIVAGAEVDVEWSGE